jgi:hypothetical protein
VDEAKADSPIPLAYAEAVRATATQAGSVDQMRARAGTLLAAGSLVSAFLGGQALAGPSLVNGAVVRADIGSAGWVAIGCFVAIFLVCGVILWPYTWEFSQLPSGLIENYEADSSIRLVDAQRDLALHLEESLEKNERILVGLGYAFGVGMLLLVAETLAWLIELQP